MQEMCQWSKAPHRLVEFQPFKVHHIHLQVQWDRDCIQVQPSWLPNYHLNTSFPPTCYYCDFASSASSSTPTHPPPPHHKPHGCSLVFIIAAIIVPVLIILSFLGLGLTLFAPSLSLSGSTTVVQGGTFTLHGSHFIPGSSVTLTLDDTIPLYFSNRNLPVQSAHTANTAMQILTMDTRLAQQLAFSNNTVSVGGDGTFAVTITANPGWSIGKHTIKASESPTHRSTSLNFTIYLAGTTPTPTTTGSTSPTPSPLHLTIQLQRLHLQLRLLFQV